jgi:uncharacterized membrane protein YdjX (TVP38/TMEM64 family)
MWGPYTMQKQKKRALVIGALVLFIVAIVLCWYYAGDYFSLEVLQERAISLRQSVVTHYALALSLYVGMYICAVAIGIPVIGPFTLFGGFLFGAVVAFVCALGSIAIGVTISFLVIRYFLVQAFGQRFAQQKIKFVERMQKYGSTYLITLNLLTIVPFFIINTLAALSDVSIWTLIWTSLVGSTPMLVVYAFAGKKFAEISSIGDIFSPPLIAVFIVFVLLSLVPLVMKRLQYMNDFDV